MSSSSLGVNAFRSGVQVAARQFEKRYTRVLLPTAPFSTRCFSSGPYPARQQRQTRQGGNDRTTITASHALLRNTRPGLFPQWPGIRTIFGGNDVTIITHYIDLPPNYVDREGLPFAYHPPEAEEVVALFGPNISTAAANELLRILHGRRVAGTLEDPSVLINTAHFAKKHQSIALEYLRKHLPVDEIANAGLRAEDELAALENPSPENEEEISEPGSTGNRFYKDADGQSKKSVYGTSALDAIRAHNQAKWKAKLQRQEEEQRKREEEERHGEAGPLQVMDQTQPRPKGLRVALPPPSPKMQEYQQKGMSDLQEMPVMSKWKRLWPSAALVLVVTGLCVALGEFYSPPKRADRLFPDIPPAAATVGALILANVVGFGLWKIPRLWRLLNQHFIIVAATPRAATMLTGVFSHQAFMHLVPNMVVLWLLGVRLHDEVGRGTFLATYFASGALAGLGTLSIAVLRNNLVLASLGASGAVYGVGAAYLWLHRFDYFKFFGFPLPPNEGFQGLSIMALVAAVNIGIAFTRARSKMDTTSHLTGLVTGVLAGHLYENKKKEARQRLERGAVSRTTMVQRPLATK